MQPAIHITTTVLPDNRIEIELPPGTAGQQVTVFIVLTDNSVTTSKSPPASSSELKKIAADPDDIKELAESNSIYTVPTKSCSVVSDILARIRSRPRVNPLEFGLLDSTDLIREDRER